MSTVGGAGGSSARPFGHQLQPWASGSTFYRSAHVPTGPEEYAKAFEGDQPISWPCSVSSPQRCAGGLMWWCSRRGSTSRRTRSSLLQSRGMKVVILHTECPYEDAKRLQGAAYADLNLINDPTNLESRSAWCSRTATICPTPMTRRCIPQGPSVAQYKSDVCFVGTGFPSRAEFLEVVDWSGLDVLLAGSWHYTPRRLPAAPCSSPTNSTSACRMTRRSRCTAQPR